MTGVAFLSLATSGQALLIACFFHVSFCDDFVVFSAEVISRFFERESVW
jgi:hypothetical protein